MGTPNKVYETVDGPVWSSRSVAIVHLIIALVQDRPYMLITKRSETMTDSPGKWCVPCGYLDWDETVDEAALREVLEETGFDLSAVPEENVIGSLNLVGLDSSPTSNRQNVTLKYLSMIELTELPVLHPNNSECSEIKWATGTDIARLFNEFAFDHFNLIVGMVQQGMR